MRLLLLLPLATLATIASDRTFEASAATARGGAGDQGSAPRLSSSIPALRISRADHIPVTAPLVAIDEYCRSLSYEKVPTTSLGREIASRGRHITSEVRIGGHVAVGYVRTLVAGTSAICYPVEGHVAIADRDRLIAIILNAREPREQNLVGKPASVKSFLCPARTI